MPGRKEVKGGAAGLTLVSSITNLSSSCQANGTVTGWPTGASYPFVITLDRGIASEERVLCTSLAGSAPATINFSTRGYDGTAATGHNSGATIEHTLDADSIDSLFAHNFDTTRDDHTQYIRTNGTRAFTALTAIAGTPVSVGTSNQAGTALTLARSDHQHVIGAGAINNSNMFAAGVINSAALGGNSVIAGKIDPTAADGATIQVGLGVLFVPDNGISTVKIANSAVDVNKIANGAVDSNKLAPNAVINSKIAAAAIDAMSKFSSGLRPVVVCTSGTRPGSPNAGDIIYETDTKKTLQYQTVTTGWTPLWNTAWGIIDLGLSAGTGPITTTVDLAGMTVTWTAVANRRIKISQHIVYSETQADRIQINFTDAANTGIGGQVWTSETNATIVRDTSEIITPPAGSYTVKLRGSRLTGSGNFVVAADGASTPCQLIVEDIGPSANPA